MEFRRLVYFSYSEVVCSLCLFVAKIKIMLKVQGRSYLRGKRIVRCVRMCSLYVVFVKFGPRACVYVCGASWR